MRFWVAAITVVSAVWLHGCVRCGDDEVEENGECLTLCNSDLNCNGQETCQDGRCRPGERTIVPSSSSSAGRIASSSARESSSSAQSPSEAASSSAASSSSDASAPSSSAAESSSEAASSSSLASISNETSSSESASSSSEMGSSSSEIPACVEGARRCEGEAAIVCSGGVEIIETEACYWGCENGRCGTPVEISAAGDHTCVRTDVARAFCWGRNGDRQCGTTGSIRNIPTMLRRQVGLIPVNNISQVVTGSRHSCILHDGGTVQCFGLNTNGQRGLGGTGNPDAGTISPVVGLPPAHRISSGQNTICAQTIDAGVWCWGANPSGFIDGDAGASVPRPTPVPMLDGLDGLSLGTSFGCGRDVDGSVLCFGTNEEGQLGNDLVSPSSSPPAPLPLSDIASYHAGTQHLCVSRVDGTVHCAGRNVHGQTGRGGVVTVDGGAFLDADGGMHETTVLEPRRVTTFQPVDTVTTARLVKASSQHTCALVGDGELVCWGSNNFSKQGHPTTGEPVIQSPTSTNTVNPRVTPAQGYPDASAVLTGVQALALGDNHGCAIVDRPDSLDGGMLREVLCWGYYGTGQLGNGTNSSIGFRAQPRPVSTPQ